MVYNSRSHSFLIATGIFPPDIGGPATYGFTLASQLAHNHAVTVVTYAQSSLQSDNVPFVVRRVSRKIPKLLRYGAFYYVLRREARKSDVVFALNATSVGWLALQVARNFKKNFWVKIVGDAAWERAIITGRTDMLIDEFQKKSKRGWIGIVHKLQTNVAKRADGILVPSHYLRRLVEGWGVSHQKIHVVYNSVEVPSVKLDRETARKEIGISGNIILSFGRLVPWNGFRMLVKIMPRLLELNPFFRLVIIGSGPESTVLTAMINNLNLEKKVYLVGQKTRQELAIYFAAADMCVLNSGYEGSLHQVLEAMAAGVPVITTNVGGNSEVVRQGENGFLVPYNDEFNLFEAIKALWKYPHLCDRFISMGRKTVQHFSVVRMVEETKKLLIQ